MVYISGEYSQRHLKESRSGRESNKLNMASRMNGAMRGERKHEIQRGRKERRNRRFKERIKRERTKS